MKIIMRKSFICLLSAILFCSTCLVGVSAAELSPNVFDSYIQFYNSNQRMESDGSFIFEFNYRVVSDRFTANSTSIRIDTCCVVCMWDGTGDEFTDSNEKFKVTLYHDGFFFDSAVGHYIGKADNIYGGKTFTDIKKGDKYYFEITPVNENLSMTPRHLKGYGKVSNVTVN